MKTIRFWLAGALAMLSITLAACGGGGDDKVPQDFLEAQARWKARGIVNYSYEVQRPFYGPPMVPGYEWPIRVTVRNDKVTAGTHVQSGLAATPAELSSLLTINQLFEAGITIYRTPDSSVRYAIDPSTQALSWLFLDRTVFGADDELVYEPRNLVLE